jgi:hypothetical protein
MGSAVLSVAVMIASVGLAHTAAAGAASSSAAGAAIAAGAKGWDSSPHYEGNLRTQGTKAELQCMKNAGYSFLMLYTNFTDGNEDWPTAYTNATAVGLQVVLQQGFQDSSLFSDPTNGTSTGSDDVAHAQKVNYPKGAMFFMDLESNNSASESSEVQWINNWATQITNAGYIAGAYIGQPQGLTTGDLNSTTLPKVKVFWQSDSTSAPQAPQGFVVKQNGGTASSCGYNTYSVKYDIDNSATDSKGNTLIGSSGTGTTTTSSPPSTTSTTPSTGISHDNGVILQKIAKGGGYTGPLDGVPATNTWKALQILFAGFGYTGPIDGSPATNTYMALQRFAQAGGYTGPIDGSMGSNSWKGVQTVMQRYGYTGPVDGQPGTNTYMAMQRWAKVGGYTGPLDGALGSNSWKGIQTMLRGFGYSGPIDGQPGSNTYMAEQRMAQDGGYTGPIDGAPGPNTYTALGNLV